MVRATTILAVRHKGEVAIGGDGQVSFGEAVVKHKAKKIRRMYEDKVLAGFAGAAADAFTLFEKFEGKLKEFRGNLPRAAVEVAKEWRRDKFLRKLEALLAVVDKDHSFIISGSGDVLEPDDGIVGIGSGGNYAVAAARALSKHTDLGAEAIVKEALTIASEICVYTNDQITVERL
ncbi:MAG: ATP-dependent protease subunit HslV [bacterium]|nr:ATP-dependent protease subunit HslV [bacterium]